MRMTNLFCRFKQRSFLLGRHQVRERLESGTKVSSQAFIIGTYLYFGALWWDEEKEKLK
jgi:hypothetical protein